MALATSHDPMLLEAAVAATGATRATGTQFVQELWSGYGRIVRVQLADGDRDSVIVKQIRFPSGADGGHPRGWNTDRSHRRKVRSYEVETAWYQQFAGRCSKMCRVPELLGHCERDGVQMLVLEDLDAAGYSGRARDLDANQMHACLRWLAEFHATFMGETPRGLWPEGTYWHLQTRPDELAALPDGPLKEAASQLDRRLGDCKYRTFVHGDAKVANFCFAPGKTDVAAVDFQYVGGGCGMKDVAYFISSCLDEDEAERLEVALLDVYFSALTQAVSQRRLGLDVEDLEARWRALYPVAWTDFYRFLCGWSPGHWKIHRYSERIAREVLERL